MQIEMILAIMVEARDAGNWLSLVELHEMTLFSEASISAQLRNLRKTRFGGWKVEKRVRKSEEGHFVEWEYQLGERVSTAEAEKA